jgi:hypothetical protein
LKLWVLGWQQGRNFSNHILAFHRWIRLLFGYVIMLNVTYILTRGIFNNRLRLRERNISGKSPFTTASFIGRYIIFSPLDWSRFWICWSFRCYINSKRLRSETNTPTRNYTSRTVGLQFSGETITQLLRSLYSRSLRGDCWRGTRTTRERELSFCSW